MAQLDLHLIPKIQALLQIKGHKLKLDNAIYRYDNNLKSKLIYKMYLIRQV